MKDLMSCLLIFVTFAHALTASGQESPSPKTPGYKGEYILSRNQFKDPVCMAFTRNLNQFRKLAFDQCHPRLSDKFPEFSRPTWEEIPFDLKIAAIGVKGLFRNQPARAEEKWQAWQQGVERFMHNGQARMWRTRIDLDGDGQEETLIRMDPAPSGLPPRMEHTPPSSCDYNRGELVLTEAAHPEIVEAFNGYHRGTDLVRYTGHNRYYLVEWNPFGPAYPETDIGATSGVILSQINWVGSLVTGGEICHIDWVPAGHYRPLKHRRAK